MSQNGPARHRPAKSAFITLNRENIMPLTNEQMDKIMDDHFAYETADDVEGVLSTLADNAEHDIVGWPGGVAIGPEGARPFYERLFQDLAEGKVKTTRRMYGENFMVDDSVWEGTAPGTPFGLEGKNRPLTIRLLHVVEFSDEGKIQRENVWLDQAAIAQQLPQDQ